MISASDLPRRPRAAALGVALLMAWSGTLVAGPAGEAASTGQPTRPAAQPTWPRAGTTGPAAGAGTLHAGATPLPFDAQRWTSLVREPGPAVVVFTTTDCAYCPEAIEQVRRLTRGAQPPVRLDVVVMDGADQADTFAGEPPYHLADRLFVFDGQPVRVRRSVNPAWFGQTPYLAILAGDGTARFVSGSPTAADLHR
jgi:hypothetical protein